VLFLPDTTGLSLDELDRLVGVLFWGVGWGRGGVRLREKGFELQSCVAVCDDW